MPMLTNYLNSIADDGGALITHIGLVDETGTELSGGSPAYARQAVTWDAAVAGLISPDVSLDFDIPPGDTVAGWRGYSALTVGTDFGGEDLSPESFISQGSYRLLASLTGIQHTAV